MAIAIPTILTDQLDNILETLRPRQTPENIASYATPPYVDGNRLADVMSRLVHLIDVSGLAATGGGTTSMNDTGAFTLSDSLVGSSVIFTGNVTAAIAGLSRIVTSNSTGTLNWSEPLPAPVAAGDLYSLAFATVDSDLLNMKSGKGAYGDSASNPYGDGRSLTNVLMVVIEQLGGTLPGYLDATAAQPFQLMSPHGAGNSARGHAGNILLAESIELFRDTISLYTKPA